MLKKIRNRLGSRPLCCVLLIFGSGESFATCPPEPDLATYEGYQSCLDGMTLVLDERFDSFNDLIWERSTGGFPDNACRFVPTSEHVEISDGVMRLRMEEKEIPASYSRHELKMVGSKSCASGELRTLSDYGPYGRLEARMRSPDSSGFVQSLFFFHFYKNPWQELDVELQGRLPNQVSTNIISNHAESFYECDSYSCTSNTEHHSPLPFNHTDDWHVYAIEWLPEKTQFFVDGKLVREVARAEINEDGGNYPDLPSTILMNFWLPDQKIAKWFGGRWQLDQLPLVAQYDWVRFYELNR